MEASQRGKGGTVLIRADASMSIGTGHAMRCLALAQQLKNQQWDVVFLMATENPLRDRWNSEDFEIINIEETPGSIADAQATVRHAENRNASWIIVDGYHFRGDYQRAIKKEELKVLCIDDYGHADHYCADLVLNQNVYASKDFYKSRESSTKLLLGSQYALLRREFKETKARSKPQPEARNILVTLGGGDPENVTGKILTACAQIGSADLEVTVILGGANPHHAAIELMAKELPFTCTILVNMPSMPVLMAKTDIAICSGGTTTLELLYMGVPFIAGAFADNQVAVIDALEEKQLALSVGWYRDIKGEWLAKDINDLLQDFALRTSFSEKGRKIVDGKGAERVAELLS